MLIRTALKEGIVAADHYYTQVFISIGCHLVLKTHHDFMAVPANWTHHICTS